MKSVVLFGSGRLHPDSWLRLGYQLEVASLKTAARCAVVVSLHYCWDTRECEHVRDGRWPFLPRVNKEGRKNSCSSDPSHTHRETFAGVCSSALEPCLIKRNLDEFVVKVWNSSMLFEFKFIHFGVHQGHLCIIFWRPCLLFYCLVVIFFNIFVEFVIPIYFLALLFFCVLLHFLNVNWYFSD